MAGRRYFITSARHGHSVVIERSADSHKKNVFFGLIQRNHLDFFEKRKIVIIGDRLLNVEHIEFGIRKVIKLAERRQRHDFGTVVFDQHILFHGHVKARAVFEYFVAFPFLDYFFVYVVVKYLVIDIQEAPSPKNNDVYAILAKTYPLTVIATDAVFV